MEESNQLPLKRVELSLTKFNEVAIPHHLDLLRQHKANILKYEEAGDYARVRAEQTNARRVAAQLRALLGELDALRRRVRPADLPAFDASTQRARDLTLRAVVDYLGVIERSCRALVYSTSLPRRETSPLASNRRAHAAAAGGGGGSLVSADSVGVLDEDEPLLQLQVDQHELGLREREAVLRGWSELQGEVRAVHDAWQTVQAAALAQREHVSATEGAAETSALHVAAARAHLSAAERLRGAALVAGGALGGALLGGPVGLAVGAKAGAAAALAGSLLGAAGARLLRRRPLDPPPADYPPSGDKKSA